MWTAWIIGIPAALYVIHRLALSLEERGHLYYLHKKPSGSSAAGAFVAFQRAIEPQAQHVEHVRHIEQRVEDDEPTGRGEADPSAEVSIEGR